MPVTVAAADVAASVCARCDRVCCDISACRFGSSSSSSSVFETVVAVAVAGSGRR